MAFAASKKERALRGRNQRNVLPRKDHAHLGPHRPGRDVLAILKAAATDRVPHLLQLKYERMKASPFGFFRGAVPVMAFDLGALPNSGIVNQICGDMHLRNLGAYAAPDGHLVFDINDFDETLRGPFEWDVKRMATSVHLAAREARETEASCRDAVRAFLRRYRHSVRRFAALPVLELGRFRIHREGGGLALAQAFLKAEHSTPVHLRNTLTETARAGHGAGRNPDQRKNGRVFRNEPPVLERLPTQRADAVLRSLHLYGRTIEPERLHLLSRYRTVDVAFKVVGTGSVGLRAYCVYFEGNGPDDPLFLQIKQEVASAWAPYLPTEAVSAAGRRHAGRRVVEGQRAMQMQSDPFLGYTRVGKRDFLVRQLNDHKSSVALEDLTAEALLHYADVCGELLARGHARSGDPDALAGYLGRGPSFDKAVADFARQYADQTERDWEQLRRSAAVPSAG